MSPIGGRLGDHIIWCQAAQHACKKHANTICIGRVRDPVFACFRGAAVLLFFGRVVVGSSPPSHRCAPDLSISLSRSPGMSMLLEAQLLSCSHSPQLRHLL